VQVSSAGDKVITEGDLAKITDALKAKGIDYKSTKLSNRRILVRFKDNASQLSAKDALKEKLGRGYVVALNLAPSDPTH
jgi:preprotein translocase subunit SecD